MLEKILSSVISSVLGGGANQSKVIEMLQSLLASQGGLDGVIEKFKQGGLEQIVKSWISTDENKSITSEQVVDVFGKESVQEAADKAGVDQKEAGDLLSEYLPQIVDKLSPNGHLDVKNLDTASLLEQGAKAVLGKLFGKA